VCRGDVCGNRVWRGEEGTVIGLRVLGGREKDLRWWRRKPSNPSGRREPRATLKEEFAYLGKKGNTNTGEGRKEGHSLRGKKGGIPLIEGGVCLHLKKKGRRTLLFSGIQEKEGEKCSIVRGEERSHPSASKDERGKPDLLISPWRAQFGKRGSKKPQFALQTALFADQ